MILARQCEAWGALPEAGGMNDQPAGLLDKMQTCRNVYASVAGYNNARDGVAWADSNPHLWQVYTLVKKLENEE